ncbi:MAG TPA: type VI secretion system tube protein Hcp [Gemmata sp.]|jgi:type VI secretion system secreted protein Hcp|nr:type VI secretion system tube protein Hcp [Gemmata sp.]
MASDYLLQIDGIKGESQDDKHKDTIEIMSFSWGATNTGISASGTGGGAGKVSFQDLHVMKSVDKASPLLMLACASGQHIKSAVLYVRKQGGNQQDYYTVTLTDLLVSSFKSGAGPLATTRDSSAEIDLEQESGPVPVDFVSLNFSKISFEYKPQKPDGSLDSAISAGWDVKANKKQ